MDALGTVRRVSRARVELERQAASAPVKTVPRHVLEGREFWPVKVFQAERDPVTVLAVLADRPDWMGKLPEGLQFTGRGRNASVKLAGVEVLRLEAPTNVQLRGGRQAAYQRLRVVALSGQEGLAAELGLSGVFKVLETVAKLGRPAASLPAAQRGWMVSQIIAAEARRHGAEVQGKLPELARPVSRALRQPGTTTWTEVESKARARERREF